MKRMWLLFLGVSIALGSCAQERNIKKPIPTKVPVNKAILELSFIRSNGPKTSSLSFGAKPEFVLPKVDFSRAQKVLAYKDGFNPIVVSPDEIAFYEKEGYGLEPIQKVYAFGSFEQAHLNLLLARSLWNISMGKGITVAVIDSGLDRRHKSLRAVSFTGYNFINDGVAAEDKSGHGTAISALIAGRGPQMGIAPEARILPLKVLDEHNQGSNYDVTRAILFAADLLKGMPNPKPADIINLSLGSYSYSPAMHAAIKKAVAKGIIVVAAAGNSGKSRIAYPAALPEVVSVGAAQLVSNEWSLMPYSNYGKSGDILAPLGGQAKLNWGTYAEAGLLSAKANTLESSTYVHGTSFAAAEVSAVAALLLSLKKDSALATKTLLNSAIDLGAKGWDSRFANGVLSPLAALHSMTQNNITNAIVVELLDAVSKQEISRYQLLKNKELVLSPGKYRLFAFEDVNNDQLWQPNEAYFESGQLNVRANKKYNQVISLN